jgi:hypothetical protein
MLLDIGITILLWTYLYSGAASVTAWQRLSVYQPVWLSSLKCITDWVHIASVLRSVIHVFIMSVYKTCYTYTILSTESLRRTECKHRRHWETPEWT